MDENMTFTVLGDDGEEVRCEVLFTFQNEETGKHYIVYTDNTTDEDGDTKVYASIFDPDGVESRLDPIETEEEWATIEQILDQLQQDILEGKEIPGEMTLPSEEDNIIPFQRPGE